MENISDLENKIRELINHPRKKYLLLMNSAQWYQLCSSLDVIGDTELAIDAYLQDINEPADTGELYIILYGILQVLFVQQDAVRHLAEVLHLEPEQSKTLIKIKEIRNDSIGHPTKREQGKGKGKEKWCNFISRISMSRNGFTLITTYPDRNATSKRVDVPQLITEQRLELRKILNNVIDLLKGEAMEHKRQFKDEKLALIFPVTLLYFFEKIRESIAGATPAQFGLGMVYIVSKVVCQLKEACEERDIFEAYNLADDFEWAEYSLQRIRGYFEGTSGYAFTNKDAYIYVSFLQKQLDDLRQTAEEIDEDYDIENPESEESAS